MTKSTGERRLVPTLRFPEFRDAGEWEHKELSPFVIEHSERVPADTQLTIFSSTRNGLKPQKDYYDNRELINDGEYGVVPDGYFVYRHMSDDGAFKFNINTTGGQIAVSKEYPVFATINLHQDFLLHLLNDAEDFKRFAFAQKKGGTRTRLYLNTLCTWKALLPSYLEQQKIADCLASLDELITLESQQLDALKTHKNGLLQQLFPAPGEALPKLRFPEFRDAGEWVEEPLGKLSSYENGKAYEQDITEHGKYIVVNSRFISTDGAVRKYTNAEHLTAEVGDVLMVLSDLPKGKALAKCYFVEIDDRYAVNQRVCRLQADKVDAKFLFYILNRNSHLLSFDDGLNQTHLSKSNVLECPLCIPQRREEQQRIADCLTTIDAIITAQAKKLVTLKTFKKGLGQQIFPGTDEE